VTDKERPASERVAVILAIGISLSLNVVTCAMMYAAWTRITAGGTVGLSENGTQLLTGWGGGIIGVLGSYIGFTFGKRYNGKGPEPVDGNDAPPAS
jgi:uncharacterized membrane protein